MKLSHSINVRLPILLGVGGVSFLVVFIAFESLLAAASVLAFWSIALLVLSKIDLEGYTFRTLVAFVSYGISVFGAFMISLCLFMPLLVLGAICHFPPWWVLAVHAITGFFAVFIPSFCLPQASRWFAALVLLVGSSGLYCLCFLGQDVSLIVQGQTFHSDWQHFGSLASAGFTAVTIHWFRRKHSDSICDNASA